VSDERTEQLVEWLDRAMASGEIVLGEEIIFDGEGDTISAAHYWNGAIVPLADRQGQITELVLLATNITEQVATRNRVEELVRVAGTRAAELEAIVSSMTDPVTVCDASGHIRLANRAALETFGVASLAELAALPDFVERIQLRQTDGRVVAGEDRPLVRALSGETLHEDYTLFHHGLGRDVHRRSSAAPVRDAAGEIVGAVTVETDITSLIEVDRLKDEFFSVAAHELRTPLTAMKGYVQILSRLIQGSEDPLVPRALATLREQGERMERLINELLDFARIESRQLELRYRDLDLIVLLDQIASDTARVTRQHQIQVRHDMAELPGRWDPDRLAQVFGNLLTNAIKYSPEGGPIDVLVDYATDKPDWVVVQVTDEGIGIPVDQIPRLFARYSRVRDDRQDQPTGLGLGLYITREIVEAHGGTITVRSAAGQGATFIVRLPLQPIAEPAAPPPPDRARTAPL
jgi:signal transduction histidine kinase